MDVLIYLAGTNVHADNYAVDTCRNVSQLLNRRRRRSDCAKTTDKRSNKT